MKRKVKHKVIAPNIVRGGQAIPMGNNFYYMKGRKHSQGGIDIGKNPRTGLEVEDGEIMEMSPKEVKVYSSVPFLNGKSPAQKVLGGENPTTVFRQQEEYKDKNNINDDGSKNKKSMGGLKRSKDYGSKSKPYPNVDKKDFAGENRSYPIPTKADAVDALRLAGLHGRSDIRVKVYSKYPELRKKAKNGIVYSLTNNGKTSLRMIPSTGERVKVNNNNKLYGCRKRAEWGADFWKNIAKEQEKEKRRLDLNNKLSGNYNFDNAVILNTNDLPKAENTIVKGSVDNLNIPSYIKNNKNGKLNNFLTKMKTSVGNYFKDKDNVSDAISLGGNLLGNIISSGINSRMINNIQIPNKPTAPINKHATKLKTKININPQLTNMRESLAAYERSVDENTSSSQVALSRKQRARAANLLNTNVLYANKENQETELINRDRLNQQSVANETVAAYNNYLDRLMDYENKKTEIENKKLELSAENKIATIENINNSIQNLLTNRQKRKSEKQNIAAMSFANPNLPAEMLYAQGLINKETYDAYRKAYPLKSK